MNPVAQRFQELRAAGKKAFIPYIMGGDPALGKTADLIRILDAGGADLIEVGVPFSDPLADGPVIQQAAIRSLRQGCTLAKLLEMMREVNRGIKTPTLLMIYYNMIFQRGLAEFFTAVRESGCAGLIIPDLPPDEADSVRQMAAESGIALNFLVAPTSSRARIIRAAECSSGFLYAVSLKGVTGARTEVPPELPQYLDFIKSLTDRPVAVGFGIATPDQAKAVAGLADGVIIGSAIVQAAAEKDPEQFAALIRGLRQAI